MEGDRAVDDAAAESKGTGEVNINIRCTADHSQFSVQISLESPVESFKEAIAQKRDISPGQQRLVCKGRVLRNDHQTLKSYDLEDGDTVYLTREPVTAATANTTGGTRGSKNNNSLTRDVMKTPIMLSLMNNPDIVRDLLMSNPELAHILNDPDTLRLILEAVRDPELMLEMMRITDREISNTESSPEGFNMLRRTYEDLKAGAGTQDGQDSNPSTDFSSTSSEAIAGSSSPSTSPLPNPWTSTRAGRTQNNTTGSTSEGNAQAPTALGLDLLEPEGSAGTMLDPTLLTQISDFSRTLQSIFSLSQAVIPMLDAYAGQHGTPDLTPYLRQTVQNLEACLQRVHLSQLGQQLSTQESGRDTGVQDPMIPSNMSHGLGTGSPAVPNSNSNEPPEQLYATQLSQLQEMGFSDMQENIRALTATSGDVHEAVKQLSGNSGQ